MSNKLVICDTGPLIALSSIHALTLLPKIFSKVIIPQSVFDESTINLHLPGADQILQAQRIEIFEVQKDPVDLLPQLDLLGPGESVAIQMAINLKGILLIDEKIGRNIAKQLQVLIMGTAGLLLAAYKKGLIADIEKSLNSIQKAGYHISNDLISAIVKESKLFR